MTRKDVIIISVLVNAALLVILFVSAINSNDEKRFEKTLSQEEILKDELNEDTFSMLENEKKHELNILKEEDKKESEFLAIAEEKIVADPIQEEKIVHKLPIASSIEEVKKVKEVLNTNSIDVTVQKGDSLDRIARKHKVKISEIIKLNNLSSSFLKVGQKLSVPVNENKKEIVLANPIKEMKKELMDPEYYIVKTGDNPYTIAMKHNIKLSTLLRLNELNEKRARKLKPGDKLRIR
ncbi:MAG: N-acetylmuramoyl-L-alanine amidase sle1 [Candidatus Anoxychlamydiales bacterium]|nr:N-acetylmuramoyl-L-alanine amidase sle1 [Candidatus Anoxychlamydiales bacterium]